MLNVIGHGGFRTRHQQTTEPMRAHANDLTTSCCLKANTNVPTIPEIFDVPRFTSTSRWRRWGLGRRRAAPVRPPFPSHPKAIRAQRFSQRSRARRTKAHASKHVQRMDRGIAPASAPVPEPGSIGSPNNTTTRLYTTNKLGAQSESTLAQDGAAPEQTSTHAPVAVAAALHLLTPPPPSWPYAWPSASSPPS